jgi:succinyl-diaminopimelate desuccinylase
VGEITVATRQELVDLTSALMRFKSTKDNPKELMNVIDFIEKYFAQENHSIRRFESNGKPSIVIMPKGLKRPRLLFLSHADVVPAPDEDFIPKLKGNRLIGRGSMDMKAGLAISMLIMKRNKDCCFGIMATTDEEVGGFDGARLLSKKYSPDLVIAPEASGLDINHKEKGAVWLRLVAKGKSCHASRPWSGKNAIDELLDAYSKIKGAFPRVTKEAWKTTLSAGTIKAGTAPNVVPDHAEMELDIRHTEDKTPGMILKTIKKAVADNDVEIVVIETNPALINKADDKNIRSFADSFIKVMRRKPAFIPEHGASDVRFFSQRKIAAIMFGPKGENCHGKGEFVEIDSIEKCYAILERFVKDFAG